LLLEELAGGLGSGNVLTNIDNLRKYSMDALRPYRAFPSLPPGGFIPDCVVTPERINHIQLVVKLARKFGIPIVPYGGGTGLMGAAVASKGGIIVDLRKMNRIVVMDATDKAITAEAGIILEKLSRALNKRGLMLAHDPWTRPLASLGGAISTNSFGYLGGKYGSIGDQVLGLKVVLPDSTIIQTRPAGRSSTGINLTKLFVGAEGCMGILAEATVRVFPKPEAQLIRGIRFPNFQEGFRAICKIVDRCLQPAVLDFGEPAPSGRGAALFIGYHGLKRTTSAEMRESIRIAREFDGTPMNVKAAASFWNTRHNVAYRYARRVKRMETHSVISPSERFDFIHVWLPRSRVLDYRRAVTQIMREKEIEILEYGLWGPELFSMAMSASGEEAEGRLFHAVDSAMALAQDTGGSMEYCHGVGLRLSHLMEREHGPTGMALMKALKKTIDQDGILNPGKLALA
jgi:FAD/FMN-containing dehydrogenase